jgi:hypothetical protein
MTIKGRIVKPSPRGGDIAVQPSRDERGPTRGSRENLGGNPRFKPLLPPGLMERPPTLRHRQAGQGTSASKMPSMFGTKEEGAARGDAPCCSLLCFITWSVRQTPTCSGRQPTLLFPPIPVLLTTLGSKATSPWRRHRATWKGNLIYRATMCIADDAAR